MNQIIKKYIEFKIYLYTELVDFSKAFYSIIHEYIWVEFRNQGVQIIYIKIIKDIIYKVLKARIKTEIEGDYFEIKKGVETWDSFFPTLFNCGLQ